MTDVSGVRSSCETVARKFDFTRSASCSRSTACASRRVFSVSSRAVRSRSSSRVTGASTLRAAFCPLMPWSTSLADPEQLLGARHVDAQLLGQRRQQLRLGDAVFGAEAHLALERLPRRRRQAE